MMMDNDAVHASLGAALPFFSLSSLLPISPLLTRPCIDIHAGKVKQIVGSSLKDDDQGLVTNFEAKLSAEYFAK